MSNISRLLGLAQKALDKAVSASDGPRSQAQPQSQPQSQPQPTRPVPAAQAASTPPAARAARAAASDPADRAAIARYDYLLQTADPHQIEQVHREAFERLTPAQRAQIDERMRAELPGHEHPRSSRPDDLARAATRTEMGRPGMLRGLLARAGGRGTSGSRTGAGGAMGGAVAGAGLAAGGMLAAVAGGAVVSSVAGPLLEQATSLGVDFDALAGAVDVEALTGGVEGLAGGVEGLTGGVEGLTGGVDEVAAGAGETVSGLGDQVSGLGDQVRELASGFEIPGLGDLFRR
ncbi:hypothetical protein N1027_07715 [Herbiconiux sp. CPCC 205763]|uniref:Cation-transporting ATPase n=1 Tax=Herbiconiux aconitum TaxID=2970913 RepID=A0ABT2GPA7_9MICO|nr:hypothetical protein [Herbiconiux aconitum]MCS5718023.1 hypothetical protein [Herbiconiux aconitum]